VCSSDPARPIGIGPLSQLPSGNWTRRGVVFFYIIFQPTRDCFPHRRHQNPPKRRLNQRTSIASSVFFLWRPLFYPTLVLSTFVLSLSLPLSTVRPAKPAILLLASGLDSPRLLPSSLTPGHCLPPLAPPQANKAGRYRSRPSPCSDAVRPRASLIPPIGRAIVIRFTPRRQLPRAGQWFNLCDCHPHSILVV
jgi:hypothetical protein